MIILKCILEKNKLRIKFHCFIDGENKIYNNVYNNNYNCKFPKDIRTNNRYYKVNDDDISLINADTKQPFYNINKKNIIIMTDDEVNNLLNSALDISNMKIYDCEECVICMSPIDSLKGSLNCVNILHKNFTNILYLNAFSL